MLIPRLLSKRYLPALYQHRPLIHLHHTMGDHKKKKVIAVCQMTSTNDVAQNYLTVKSLVEEARIKGAQMVFLPEGCDYITGNPPDTIGLAFTLDSKIIQDYCSLAKANSVWLSIGGIHEKISSDKIQNTHLIINDEGNIISIYRKLHLYDVVLPEKKVVIQESAFTARGKEIVPPVDTPVGCVGLATCYDVRFPELSLALREMGAEILTFPSAFMKCTGEVHWEALLRARAIDCQCYVVAAAQTGQHSPHRVSWGHAMIVEPWGSIVAECTPDKNIAYAEIDPGYLYDIRSAMPLWQQRRNDLYPLLAPLKKVAVPHQDIYQFGQTSVKSSCVFYRTQLTIAFTNLRCVLPGHVLVSPIRCVKRMTDLTPEEIADLFLVVQKVQRVMEQVHNVCSSTIALQDGKHAGQSIHHVHVHILPRREGDFAKNDHIYHELQKHDKTDQNVRSENEMVSEASMLSKYF